MDESTEAEVCVYLRFPELRGQQDENCRDDTKEVAVAIAVIVDNKLK